MSELLEYRTLFVASGSVGGALLMLFALQTGKPYRGFVRVAVGLQVLGAAILIGGLRGYVPDALWIIQVTALSTFGLIDSGIRVFCGRPRRGRWPYIYVLLAMILQTYLFFTEPIHLRILSTSLLLIPISLDAALALLRTTPRESKFGHHFTATVFLLFCVAASFRVISVVLSRGSDSPYFARNPANTIFFLLLFFLILACAFGLIALTHERLMAELKARHEQFVSESQERARAEQQLAQSEQLAAVGRLAGGIAHFFNNDAHVIQLSCWLLRDFLSATGSPAFKYIINSDYIAQIENASRRSSEIAGRMLQFAQSKILQTSKFDPTPMLDRIIPELRMAAGEKIEVTTSATAKVPAVELDADVLKEAIVALARNAREAMPVGGKLSISLREEELDPVRAKQLGIPPSTFVLLSVADTGSGMDAETLRHVFEPFFTTQARANVEGLGLASAYGFIRQSGGTITVRSTPKRGSTFELYLPTARL
jgi:signal transduction histidine kinase